MTRKLLAAVLALMLVLSLVGCQQASPSDDDGLPQPTVNWGITLSAEEVTATGLTLVITQAGGEPVGGLEYGSEFSLDVLKDGVWESIPYIDENIAWTLEAYVVPRESTTNQSVCWDWVYGSLPAGTYRIGKRFADFRGVGEYDTEMFYAKFEIK